MSSTASHRERTGTEHAASLQIGVPTQVGQRNQTLDALRLVLAFMVVGLHGHFWRDVQPEVSHFLENYLFRIAVPVFFMVNGYYFAGQLARKPFRAWASRIAMLYVSWTLVYSFFILRVGFGTAIKYLAVGYFHLWYLPATLCAAALVYVLRDLRPCTFVGLIVLAFGLGLGIQYAGNYHVASAAVDDVLNNTYLYRNFLFFGFPFFGMGFLMAKTDMAGRVSAGAIAVGILVGALLLVFEYAVNTSRALSTSESFDLLAALPVLCIAAFLWAVRQPASAPCLPLGGMSTVVFFAHPLFLYALPKFHIASETLLVVGAIAGSLAAYPLIALANRRWPLFI